jgi:hypothetical protein
MSDLCSFEVVPTKQLTVPNRTTPVSLNYTNQDFWSLKSRLVSYTREKFGDVFNDFIESNLAMMLIENWAFIGDMLSFKIDQIANELFIDTVTELDNAFRLAKLVGFQPQPPIGAKSMWTGRIQSVQNIDLIIQSPLNIELVSNEESLTIELYAADQYNRPIFDEDIVISAGTLVNSSLVGLEGRTFTETTFGNGDINQSYFLKFAPVIFDSVRIYVDGQRWEQVDYFTESAPRPEYRVEYTSNFSVYVIFGNNRAGLIPPTGSAINVVYRVGGGISGNIVSNFVSNDIMVPIEGQAYSIPVNFSNYTRGMFGSSGDTVEDIRRKLPAYLNSQNRCVSGQDYKAFVDLFRTGYNGVTGKSTAVVRHTGCSANIIDIFVLVKEGDDDLAKPNSQFKQELINTLDGRKMLTDNVNILDGEVVKVDVNLQVFINRQFRTFEQNINEKIMRDLAIFFNIQNWEYGQSLRDIDLLKALANVAEPYQYEITFITDDQNNGGKLVTTKFFQIIRPNNLNVNYTYTA